MWVPDLLYLEQPYCPDCADNSAVSMNKQPKWVRGGPMRVFGRYSSYYLDTEHYHLTPSTTISYSVLAFLHSRRLSICSRGLWLAGIAADSAKCGEQHSERTEEWRRFNDMACNVDCIFNGKRRRDAHHQRRTGSRAHEAAGKSVGSKVQIALSCLPQVWLRVLPPPSR